MVTTSSSNGLRDSVSIVNELEQEQSSELRELIWLLKDENCLSHREKIWCCLQVVLYSCVTEDLKLRPIVTFRKTSETI